jgi:WD40 repeat protein
MDKSVKLWDANNLNYKPVILKPHGDNFVLSVAFSPDGRYFLSSADQKDLSRTNYIYYWPTNEDSMAELLCSKLERNFTPREWESYVGQDIEYQKTCSNK